MARLDMGPAEAGLIGGGATAELLLQIGLGHASGRAGAIDRVSAHKYFNLAAARGHRDAVRHRREIAAEMTSAEIAEAQRQARAWLGLH